jgi:phosphatidate cytidylyltransferase
VSAPIGLERAAQVDPKKKKLPIWQRVVGGSIAIAVVCGAFFVDRQLATPWLSVGLFGILVVAAAWELVRMLPLAPFARAAGLACTAFVVLKVALLASGRAGAWLEPAALVAFVLVAMLLEARAGEPQRGAPRLFAGTFAFTVVVFLSYVFDLLLGFGAPRGLVLALLLVLTSKSNDIGGYLVGRAIGGPRLAPGISPGKTWAGAVGGFALALLVAQLLGRALDAGLTPGALLLFGVVVSVATQLGDLLESMMKRYCGAGDSSALLPTFGGALDVVDSLILAAPAGALLLGVDFLFN